MFRVFRDIIPLKINKASRNRATSTKCWKCRGGHRCNTKLWQSLPQMNQPHLPSKTDHALQGSQEQLVLVALHILEGALCWERACCACLITSTRFWPGDWFISSSCSLTTTTTFMNFSVSCISIMHETNYREQNWESKANALSLFMSIWDLNFAVS